MQQSGPPPRYAPPRYAPPPPSRQSVIPYGTPPPTRAPKKPYSFLRDVYYGGILGDFAPEVELPGAILHALLGFVPIVGSIFSLRDVIADWLDSDWLGLALNSLAVFPVFGGVPKVFAVIHAFLRVHRYMRRSARRSASGLTAQEVTHKRVRRLQGLGVSLLMPIFGIIYSIGVILTIELINAIWPTGLGIKFSNTLALIVMGVLCLLGAAAGEALCVRTRAWLGMFLLPLTLLIILLPGAFALLSG